MREIWGLDHIHHTVTSVIVRSIPCISHVSCKVWAIFWWHFKILWQFLTLFIIVCAFQKKKTTLPPQKYQSKQNANCLYATFSLKIWNRQNDLFPCYVSLRAWNYWEEEEVFSHHFTDGGLILHPFHHLLFSGLHTCVNFTVHRGEHSQSIRGSGHCCSAATNRTEHSSASGVLTLEQRNGSMS